MNETNTPVSPSIDGQLSPEERNLLTECILQSKPDVVIEAGTWLGGGSTLHILRALHKNGKGRLWGIEADRSIYERLLVNIRSAVPEALDRFTPIFGFSQEVIPKWITEQGAGLSVDVAFLDGGDHPLEQVTEFELLDPFIPIGGHLFAHDAKIRKGKWFVPFLSKLDHWETRVLDSSEVGILHAVKRAEHPSPASRDAAVAILKRLRRDPIELFARLLPSSLKGTILQLLPRRLFRSIFHGSR